jgi:peptide/nickel transport system substrate-binding protein
MKAIKAVLLCLFAAVLLFATACGGNDTGANDGAEETPELAYVACYVTPVTDWDPSIGAGMENQVLANVYETLLIYDANQDVFLPCLATDYESSEDGLTWTFRLREDVLFHDGTPFTAEAVKFSFERTKNMQKGAAYIWDAMREVRVVDDYTCEIVLDELAPVDLMVSCSYGAFIMAPSLGDDYNAGTEWLSEGNDCGSGPYMIQSQVPGDEVLLTGFSDYWKGWEGKHFDKVLFKLIGENASRRQILESGEADVVMSLMAQDIAAVSENPNVNVVSYESYENMLGFINMQKPPLDDVRVRKALAYAWPGDQVIEYVKLGQASEALDILPKAMWGSNTGEPYYDYDPEKAKALLTEAGHPDGGFSLTYVYISGNEDRKKSAELYKSELAKLGIDLKIQGMQWDSIAAMAKAEDPNDRQDILNMKQWNDLVSPSSWYSAIIHSEEEIMWNFSYYNNPEVDEMIEEAYRLTAIDRERAAALYREIGEIVADDCIAIYQGDERGTILFNSRFKGFTPNAAYKDVIFFYDCHRE